ncbi:MAG: hypothetical protein M0031_15675 [Thermaerobacter sp.]|jgi:hypothetical protein|nr:hypothetical protein [Thermaerobacter sp.]
MIRNQAWVTPAQAQGTRRLAARFGIPEGEVVRRALDAHLRRMEAVEAVGGAPSDGPGRGISADLAGPTEARPAEDHGLGLRKMKLGTGTGS